MIIRQSNYIIAIALALLLGSTVYFALPLEPQIIPFLLFAFGIMLLIAVILRHEITENIFAYSLIIFIFLGFALAMIRAQNLNTYFPKYRIAKTSIKGEIEKIEYFPDKLRLVIKNADVSKDRHISKIRVKTDIVKNLNIGDKVSFKATLYPPSLPILPNSYNLARNLYFKELNATGYVIGNMNIIESSPASFLRNNVIANIDQAINGQPKAVILALLAGERGKISAQNMTNIRNSGLAHLLAISGLHIAMVAASIFFLIRLLLTFNSKISLYYESHKIAAIFAVAGSFFYLVISGMPVSAQRAFILVSLFFIAMLLDKPFSALNILAIALIFMIITKPESILSPALQMSFAASAALIIFFEKFNKLITAEHDISLFKKLSLYCLGIIASSIIAILATSPFVLLHFNQIATYGVLANLIAIPLVTFLIMPLGFLAILSMPLNLEYVFLKLASYPIEIILKISQYIAHLPLSIVTVPDISFYILLPIASAIILLLLLKAKKKFFAIIPLFLLFIPSPKLIMIVDSSRFFVIHQDGNFFFSKEKIKDFKKDTYLKKLNIKQLNPLPPAICNETYCTYKNILIIKKPLSYLFRELCTQNQIIVNFTNHTHICSKPIIDNWDLRKDGTHFIFRHKEKYKIKSIHDYYGNRVWLP
jgi:competence protein ComEC